MLKVAARLIIGLAVLAACSGKEVQDGAGSEEMLFGEQVSVFQQEILADGVLTEAEYRSAWEAHRRCVEEQGLTVGPLERTDGDGDWTFAISAQSDSDGIDPTSEQFQMVDQIFFECEREYTLVLQHWWYNEQIPVGEERDRALEEMIVCLEGHGVSGVLPTDDEFDVQERIREALEGDDIGQQQAWLCVDRAAVFRTPIPQ